MQHNVLTSIALASFALPAGAGSVFEMSEAGGAGAAQTISIQDGKLHVETSGLPGMSATDMIFADDVLTIVDEGEGSYYRITPATIEQLGAALEQASAMMEQMREQLQNLPAEQREMMERMMRGRMPDLGAGAAPAVRVERGAAENVAGYACTEFSIYVDDTLTQELCAADFGDVPGAADMTDMVGRMAAFFEGLRASMPPALQSMQNNPFDTMSRIEGFPVRTRTYINGSVQQELVLSSAETRDLPASLFEVPAGLTERELLPQQGGFPQGGNPLGGGNPFGR